MPSVEKYIKKNSGDFDDAKDIFHDALLNFILKVKEGKDDIGDIKGYLFVSCRNSWITKQRRAQKFSSTETMIMNEGHDEVNENMDEQERSDIMDELLTALGERCKELLKLTFYMDFSLKEAAEALGISSDEVAKTTQYRCKKKLTALIKENKTLVQHYYN